jgi:hypothetical protein
VAGNKGAETAGVDGATVSYIETQVGVGVFLGRIREEVKSGEFRPAAARRVLIPKKSGKLRKLGIPTVVDRVVQASLKAVLEPIFEADFQPCSYGFRPNRRPHDAIAEIHHLASGNSKGLPKNNTQTRGIPLVDVVRASRRRPDGRELGHRPDPAAPQRPSTADAAARPDAGKSSETSPPAPVGSSPRRLYHNNESNHGKLRVIFLQALTTTGSWRRTSKPASMKSRTRHCWVGCGGGSRTSGCACW